MNIYNKVRNDLIQAIKEIFPDYQDFTPITIETPKDSLHGDMASNVAMIMASNLKSNPREIAVQLKAKMSNLNYIAHIEIAGPGFLNFTLKYGEWQNCVKYILEQGTSYGSIDLGKGEKVNIEYVSANPTGPMHIGHARGAVYGDILARLLEKCNYKVTKEYYVNDAGSQIEILAKSVLIRARAILENIEAIIPEGFYPGGYLIKTAENLVEQHKDLLLNKSDAEIIPFVSKFTLDAMLSIIKEDLKELGIKHDIFFFESHLQLNNHMEEAISVLKKLDLVYEGILEAPKGQIDEDWQPRKQLLFKSTAFEDDSDRPLQKEDGSFTYFASDIAYANDKIKRKYEHIVIILGADHAGYVKRLEAVYKALSDNKVKIHIKLCQLVNFLENGVPTKMSKRAGNFTTVKDVTKEVGKDIIRFMMLTRKNDIGLDFDLVKVKELSKDNPIFYVQYAYVRTKSILHNAKNSSPEAYNKFISNDINFNLLSSEEELNLIKQLACWPKVIELSAYYFEPHRLAFYLQSLASTFHSLWNLGNENKQLRFIIEDTSLTAARLALARAVTNIISSGLEIIGITPVEKM